MTDRKAYLAIVLGLVSLAVFFFLRPDSKAALFKFVTKKPAQLAGLPEAEKVEPKNINLIAALVSDFVSPLRVVEPLDKNTVIKNIKSYEAANGSVKTIPICDLLKFSGKSYDQAGRVEIKNDLFEILRTQAEDTIENRCAGTRTCDPLYGEILRSNNAEDLEWIEPFSQARSTEEVLSLNIKGDEILYFRALVLGGQLVAQEINSVIDLKKSISMLQYLENKYPNNGIYPYMMIAIKAKAQMSFQGDLERFLNAKDWVGPAERFRDFLYRQATVSPANYFSYLAKLEVSPKPSYYATHQIFKTIIPQLPEFQKEKFKKIAGFLYDLNVHNKGRLSGLLGRSYADNWLRRLHDAKVSEFVDDNEIPKGTINDPRLWDHFYDKVFDGKCDETELTNVFKNERNWAEQDMMVK